MKSWKSLIALALMAFSFAVVAAEPEKGAAEGAQTASPAAKPGNQELPKVLYIVPWKKSAQDADASSVRPQFSVINEELAPIDRDVLRRQLQSQAPQQSGQKTNK